LTFATSSVVYLLVTVRSEAAPPLVLAGIGIIAAGGMWLVERVA
jgi:hypothetical protein